MSTEEATVTLDNNRENVNTVTETILPQSSSQDSVAQMIDAFVSMKESVYGFLRQILSDLVTIIKRSARMARDWAVEDEVGQLVSSGLFLVGFFAFVAAFAAWNIEVLSGGKSKWSGPQNGVTMPVVKGLPTGSTTTTSPEIRFQKPKWKAPKIQTSYNNDRIENSRDKNIVISYSDE